MSIINANSPSLTASERELENLTPVRHPSEIPPKLSEVWVRNPLWLTLPTFTAGEQKFVGLFMVSNDDSNYVTMQAAGNYTVDWGDGVVENYNTGVVSYHKYDYDAISNSTYVDEGDYKQVIVTVTPQAGQNLTSLSLHNPHNVAGFPVTDTTQFTYYCTNPWLDVAINSPNLTSFRIANSTSVTAGSSIHALEALLLEKVYIGESALSNAAALFYNCQSLQSISINSNSWTATNFSAMFGRCFNLVTAPTFKTTNGTNFNGMFYQCYSLISVPSYDTTNATDMGNMFNTCRNLREAPFLSTGNVTNTGSMFINCYNLRIVPNYKLPKCAFINSMFNSCYTLERAPYLETPVAQDCSGMFQNCYNLQSVPCYNTTNVTNMNNMFNGCRVLTTVPQFNTSKVTNFSGMFYACYSLESVPLFDTRAALTLSDMFYLCSLLIKVPEFNLIKATNLTNMFFGCKALRIVPIYNTQNVTTTSSMFSSCYMLRTAPNITTSNVTVMQNMFNECRLLKNVPTYDTRNVTNMNGLFTNCVSLNEVPKFDYNKVTNMNNMFNGCVGLEKIPDFMQETKNVSSMQSTFYACISLRNVSNLHIGNVSAYFNGGFDTPFYYTSLAKLTLAGNANVSFGCNLTMLSANVISNILNTVCGNVTASMGYPFASFRNNWGANATTFSRSVTRTANSNIMTITGGTANLVNDMTILGSGSSLTVPTAVTFTAATAYVSKTNGADHGFANNTRVAFHNIVTTTGISSNVIYYTSSIDSKNFQIATTPGGSPISFTSNGSGKMRYETKIVSIVLNTSVQLDNALSFEHAGTGNIIFTAIDATKASLNGWNVILLP